MSNIVDPINLTLFANGLIARAEEQKDNIQQQASDKWFQVVLPW